MLSSFDFYSNYHGHTIENLQTLAQALHITPPNPDGTVLPNRPNVIWLAGDSSLDNKHWILGERQKAVNGMENILTPSTSVPDVAHWLNRIAEREGGKWVTVNAAVEESTLGIRQKQFLEQDTFIRDHVAPQDIIVVSAGGNDVALRPTLMTIVNMLLMVKMGSLTGIRSGSAFGTGHFKNLFRQDMERFCNYLTERHVPQAIGVCSIYYPDERVTGSWADRTLGALNYNTDPVRLQAAIDMIHEHATAQVQVRNARVVPIKFSEVLDGSNTEDYVARVEPSAQGGEKLAQLIWNRLFT